MELELKVGHGAGLQMPNPVTHCQQDDVVRQTVVVETVTLRLVQPQGMVTTTAFQVSYEN